MVPSSTMVTMGLATSSPTRPLNTDAPLPTRSASRPWPQASWNSTPPPPEPMTTGIWPLGAGRADSLVSARCAARRGQLVDVVEVEQLEADGVADALAPGLHAGVAGGHARHREERLHLVVRRQQAVAVGHQDAAAAVAVAGRHLADGAALLAGDLVGPGEQLDLAGLGHVAGVDLDDVGRGRGLAGEVDRAGAAAAPAGSGGRGLGRGGEAGLGEIGGVGEAGGVADHDPDAGPAVAARRELLDLAVVEQRGRRALVLDEDLGEVAAGAQRGAQGSADHGLFDHAWVLLSRRALWPGARAGHSGGSGDSDPDRRTDASRQGRGRIGRRGGEVLIVPRCP